MEAPVPFFWTRSISCKKRQQAHDSSLLPSYAQNFRFTAA